MGSQDNRRLLSVTWRVHRGRVPPSNLLVALAQPETMTVAATAPPATIILPQQPVRRQVLDQGSSASPGATGCVLQAITMPDEMVQVSDNEYQRLQTRIKELESAVAVRRRAEEVQD